MTKVEHQNVTVLSDDELRTLDAHWRAANYLAAGQIYLMANPLLTEPLRPEHIKPRLLAHWGTSPGLTLVYTHLNRVIKARGLDALCVWGPGHGGPSVLANPWLEGSYSETHPDVSRDAEGMARLFRQFSFPGGVPSHVAPETPGSIHEGGELGYSLAHAYGAALDNPDLLVACVMGTARRRPDRWPPPGTATSSSTRCTTERSCRSCTSTATRSPNRRCSPASWRPNRTRCCGDTGMRRSM
jgi:xylulose-5-phosphate/fructose-6-phosphate phosphoketolase